MFDAKVGPCYRCLFPEPPPPGLVPSCAEGGVLGVLPGTIGAIQATEAIKVILGEGETLVGRLLLYDALHMSFDFVKLRKNPKCPVCDWEIKDGGIQVAIGGKTVTVCCDDCAAKWKAQQGGKKGGSPR